MVVLKFISWPMTDGMTVEKVVTCDAYEVINYPDRSLGVNTFRGPPSETPTEQVFLARDAMTVSDASEGFSPDAVIHYRRLFVMNDQGKTIDSHSVERR
jgi:hypothetical protein